MQAADNYFSNYRQTVIDPDWFYYTVCGFCRSVCVPSRDERIANRKLIINSGTAALKLDGSHVVAEDNAVRMRTPFGLHVVVPREELSSNRINRPNWPGQFALDRKVIEHICRQINSTDAKNRAAEP